MSDIILEAKNLTVESVLGRGTRPLLSNISFKLRPNRIFGLFGESGSGKTLTALSLMGLVGLKIPHAQTRGKILYRQLELLGAPEKTLQAIRGKKIAMVFQNPFTFFNPSLKIGRQFDEILSPFLSARIGEVLRCVQLRDEARILSSYSHELSGGQLQRVMLAMALLHRPEILIADEPTTALDSNLKWGILALLKRLKDEHGLALFIISHDKASVSKICDDTAVMEQGRLKTEVRDKEIEATEKP